MINSFIDISDLNRKNFLDIIYIENNINCLKNKSLGLLFENPSTRTRLSFSVGINQLEGNTININFENLNFSRYENFEDTFRAMNCYLDGLIYRTNDHNKLNEAKKYFKKPIINALSDKSHPCQALSDFFTLFEHFNTFDLNILWMGDMNNVCYSLIEAANLVEEINFFICTPTEISKDISWHMKSNIKVVNKISEINLSAIDCVMTDVYISMNDIDSVEKTELLKPYSVTTELMDKTSKNSVFMHCLPAKVGLEVTEEVYKSSKSIIWKQAYNRMIAQKKLLQFIKWS